MTCEEKLALLLAAVEPLLDRETMQPFYSAWEFDHGRDGERLHADLTAAYLAATSESGRYE